MADGRWKRARVMAALIVAGGIIYTLPYLRQTFHQPLRDALGLSNAQLGNLNSLFGVVAMLAYFPGGWLADRVSARVLLTASLLTTGVSGLWYAQLPSYSVMLGLHAVLGVSTILSFWSALIKATRAWGEAREQGRAFGLLDGGRGVVEAVFAMGATAVFAGFGAGARGLSAAVYLYAGAHLFAAILVFRYAPDTQRISIPTSSRPGRLWLEALSMPVVWLHAGVIFFAYVSYWGTHDFNAFATEGLGQTEVFGATLATFRTWLRPLAALLAGFMADRFRTSLVIVIGFGVTAMGFLALSVLPQGALVLLGMEVAVIALAVFALRGIYYALLQEGRVPMYLTGTTVGLISVLGYTPDIFIPQLTGWLFDTYPGAQGHRILYVIVAAGCLAGIACTLGIRRITAASANDAAPGATAGSSRPPVERPTASETIRR